MKSDDRFNEIILDEKILTIFIFLNILNFYADEFEADCLYNNDKDRIKLSKDIIIFTTFVNLLIYIYFAINNYKDVINNNDSSDSYVFNVRYIGSVLIVIGLCCFLYFRIKTKNSNDIDLSEIF